MNMMGMLEHKRLSKENDDSIETYNEECRSV